MSFFSDTAQALMACGILLAVVDLLVFGFTTFFLTLLGFAMLTTGALLYFSVLTDSSSVVIAAITVFTGLYGVLLWQPLKKLQEKRQNRKVNTDLTGMSFILQQDISPDSPGTYHYSGIDWAIETQEVITQGTEVEVVELQVGKMIVKTSQ